MTLEIGVPDKKASRVNDVRIETFLGDATGNSSPTQKLVVSASTKEEDVLYSLYSAQASFD